MTTTPADDDSRTRILRAAAEISGELGYDGTTIARICERSGLPPSSVYWFFDDKDHLLGEVVRHSFHEWEAQGGWPEPRPGADLLESLRDALMRAAETLRAAPDFLRLGLMLALERRDQEAAGRRNFIDIHRRAETTIADWFRAMIPAARLAVDPTLPEHLATFIIAASDGLFLGRQITETGDLSGDVDLVVTVVETALHDTDRA